MTSAVIGASSVEQLDTNLDALSFPTLTDEELSVIDQEAVEAGVNLWAKVDRRLKTPGRVPKRPPERPSQHTTPINTVRLLAR